MEIVEHFFYHRYGADKEGNTYYKDKYGNWKKAKHTYSADGYRTLSFDKGNGKRTTYQVHRLVLECFDGKFNKDLQVDHINTIRDDNRLENLRWCTAKENFANPISRKKYLESMSNPVTRYKLGNASRGKKFTEEHKEKISKALKGKVRSESHSKNISIAKKAKHRKMTDEEKAYLSNYWKGRVFSKEHYEHLCEANRRKAKLKKDKENGK